MPLLETETWLARFPIVDTTNAEAMRATLIGHYGATEFSTRGGPDFLARSFHAVFGDISVGLCSYATETDVSFPESDYVRLQIAVEGKARLASGGQQHALDVDHVCTTSSDRANRIEFGPGLKQVFVRIRREALNRKLEALIGARATRPIEFAPSLPAEHSGVAYIKQLLQIATRSFATHRSEAPLSMKELEQAIIVSLLETIPNTFSDRLKSANGTSGAMASHVARVENFIEAHWQEPLTIEELSRVCGVGARSIFAAFDQVRGYTPMAYLKSIRLQHARRMIASNPDLSITSVALDSGFSNLGHFAREYRVKFGELPSVTLARSRG